MENQKINGLSDVKALPLAILCGGVFGTIELINLVWGML
ncbi:hypothetical protein [Pseudoalteromonas phage J2-1_QLiu-2017]|nr:hypothetical protein [Pseudoalteromonas phage J2-1_QLiu-2017]